jgi:hypothetical protein
LETYLFYTKPPGVSFLKENLLEVDLHNLQVIVAIFLKGWAKGRARLYL